MSNQKEVRYLPATELRATKNEDGSRTVSGYAAVFNSLSVDMGGWQEMIAPGAFTRSLMSDPNVVCLRDHDNSILLGRTRSKTLTLEEDSVGLKFNCALPNTTQAADLAVLIDRGDIDGCSFGFICMLDDWKNTPDGRTVRTVLEAELFDVSVVSEPAYPDTSLSLRSAPQEIRSVIEARTAKRDDGSEVETNSSSSDCTCDCAPCVAGNCQDCTDLDCDCVGCSCESVQTWQRNYMHMTLELAKRHAK